MAVCLRLFIGLVLLVSGFEKLISPYQNFLYVIQAYQMFPSWMETAAALLVPWVELMVGIFLVLGLWLKRSLKGAVILLACFIIIVGQALLRHLPLEDCGCFGEAIHIPPQGIMVFDSLMLLSAFWLLRYPSKVKGLSLDKYFNS
ncbi:MAG: DoxX family membrane protein [Candidatus Omnitrophica bacterium]|nr:DoxX family membrane protein [Candidatus Omnitrophota bacterium]